MTATPPTGTTILGICAYHGDASAALVQDGALVAAVEEERYRRVKHWAGFPSEAIRNVLDVAGVSPDEVTHFAVGRDPSANLWKKARFVLTKRPSPRLIWDRLRNRDLVGDLPSTIAEVLDLDPDQVRSRFHHVEHHPAHLASAFFVSPFDEAAVCAVDGFGDFVSTSVGIGKGNQIEILDLVHFPHSLGLVYLAITQFLGFPRYGDEYKVMGLAAYGDPTYAERLRDVVPLRSKGRFELDLSCFRHWSDDIDFNWEDGAPTMGRVWTDHLGKALGMEPRAPDDPITDDHKDLAASLQHVFEETLFHILDHLHDLTGQTRLCMAGGTAMNSVANGKIRANTPFEEVYIQPAAADNGTSLGAAYHVWNQVLGGDRRFTMTHALWGPAFTDDDVQAALDARTADLKAAGCTVDRVDDEDERCALAARAVADGQVVGWFQGPMEWGARALGNRTILADPRRADMREVINTKVKFREEFRPFAPSILKEAIDDYFVDAVPDPFMIQVYPVREDKRDVLPAVTHVDGTGRLQSVNREQNPLYWKLIKAFEDETGVPVVLNTSFNENEPIVCRPEEALDCFLRTDMDAVVLEATLITKGQR